MLSAVRLSGSKHLHCKKICVLTVFTALVRCRRLHGWAIPVQAIGMCISARRAAFVVHLRFQAIMIKAIELGLMKQT